MKEYRNFTRKSSPPPLIGALLRRPLGSVRGRILGALAESGFGDIHPAHLNVFQYPGPHGARPTELAHAAGMTKQAMNHLLGQLEDRGYLARRELASGEHGTAIWLTPRGEAATRVMRQAVVQLETEWEELLGKQRYRTLRVLLGELNDRLEARRAP